MPDEVGLGAERILATWQGAGPVPIPNLIHEPPGDGFAVASDPYRLSLADLQHGLEAAIAAQPAGYLGVDQGSVLELDGCVFADEGCKRSEHRDVRPCRVRASGVCL